MGQAIGHLWDQLAAKNWKGAGMADTREIVGEHLPRTCQASDQTEPHSAGLKQLHPCKAAQYARVFYNIIPIL